jgi:hypothetical protein
MSEARQTRGGLPILGSDGARSLGLGGVLACTLCCISIPGIAAALSATGLGFLRNDRILLPGTAIFAGIVIVTLVRARLRHHEWGPLLIALGALVLIWVGLLAGGGARLVTLGDIALVGAVLWDSRLHRRCSA